MLNTEARVGKILLITMNVNMNQRSVLLRSFLIED